MLTRMRLMAGILVGLLATVGCSGADAPIVLGEVGPTTASASASSSGGGGDAGAGGGDAGADAPGCVNNNDCDIALRCIDSACAPPIAAGSPCMTNPEACNDGQYCDLPTDKCRPQGGLEDPCDSSLACKSGFTCAGGKCVSST